MIYTKKIQGAIKFSIKTHEVYQQQKRKGKNIPYLAHPLTVGLILALGGVSEDVIAAGILHDTIEDSTPEKKVSREMLEQRFGSAVARMVWSVTETSKELPWEQRKSEALEHIKSFSHDSLLVKSADVLSNGWELVDDYARDGELVFTRFNAPKEKIVAHSLSVIATIIESWPKNPLAADLQYLQENLKKIKI